ncbi:hypothetical protein AOLI_G00115410 [Acnodon oligacanthus]
MDWGLNGQHTVTNGLTRRWGTSAGSEGRQEARTGQRNDLAVSGHVMVNSVENSLRNGPYVMLRLSQIGQTEAQFSSSHPSMQQRVLNVKQRSSRIQ